MEIKCYKMLDGRGKVYLPAALREAVGFSRGDVLQLTVRGGVVLLGQIFAVSCEIFDSRGIRQMDMPAYPLDSLLAEIRRTSARTTLWNSCRRSSGRKTNLPQGNGKK